MDVAKIVEILAYTIPSLITGGVAYFLFEMYFRDQQNTRKWLLQKKIKKEILPIRLQAYERITLLMERINPSHLLVRISPISDDKNEYANYLVAQIEQEFEHNLSQQIYISSECWSIIIAAKNATNQLIRLSAKNETVNNADELRSSILSDLMGKQSATNAALSFIKEEVSQLW